ncbi:MAG: STAS domain-containing protein [Burkholderiaceae bacterium]
MSKETPPGFLSKVARFVKKPMTTWADLDQPEPDKSTDYSKALLKEMIERKRRNDFVRKREFDQLRKLRTRGSTMPSGLEPPSFFQSSLPSNSQERAHTLRKIDEIEAQMSKQWWKSRSPSSSATGSGELSPSASAAARAMAKTEMQSFGEVASIDDAPVLLNFASHDTVPLAMSVADRTALAPAELPLMVFADAQPLTTTNHWPDEVAAPQDAAGDAAGFVHDLELEEPAIRFANGDYEGAEAALAALIAPGAEGVDRPSIWLALFDLYRATGQQERFESIALDFAARFGRSEPVWFAFADALETGSGQGFSAPAAKAVAPTRAFGWSAPEVLTAKALAMLHASLSKGPMQPWRFNWGKVGMIETDARLPLLQLLERWSASAVRLRFVDAGQLERVLAAQAPSGDDSVDPVCWRLALALLRTMHRVDDFDCLALEYCITYEVSPPSWVDPDCTFLEGPDEVSAVGQDRSNAGSDSAIQSDYFPVLPELLELAAQPHAAMVELSGRLIGDAGERLVGVAHSHPGIKSLTVRCDKLARVDFSAAGSVLNWAAARQADGCRVEFSQLQRLVAIFFNVVGISEYARVSVRHN